MSACQLLLIDNGARDVIPNTLQLVAERMGQEYNQRKHRKGAFWEDRYHATAVESDDHLIKCLIYIDLNIVRAGAVIHSSEWSRSGYIVGQEEVYELRETNGCYRYDFIGKNSALSPENMCCHRTP